MTLSGGNFSKIGDYEEMVIQGKTIEIPPADLIFEEPFVGREDLVEKTLAAWSILDGTPPLSFRLYGPPGTGKTTLVHHLAKILGKELYVMSGSEEFRVDDIACMPSLDEKNTGNLKFRASPLFAAMIRGKIAFFDEIARAPKGALAALSPVLDQNRSLTSSCAGIKIKAAPGFLFCAALNDDDEICGALPTNISDRLLPRIYVGNASIDELKSILLSKISDRNHLWLRCFISQFKGCDLSPRLALRLLNHAVKLYENINKQNRTKRLTKRIVTEYLKKAAKDFPVKAAQESPSLNKSKKEEMDEHVLKFIRRPPRRPDKGTLH